MFSFKSWLSFESTVWHQISCQGKFLVDGFPRSFENMEGWKKVLGGSGSQRGYGMGWVWFQTRQCGFMMVYEHSKIDHSVQMWYVSVYISVLTHQ